MSIGQQILFFVSLLGAFNGFVLSVYLFVSKRIRSLTTVLLGVLLLAISLRVAKSVFLFFNHESIPKIYLQIGLSACFLIGPALYYFTRSALQQVTRPPASWKWTWGILLGVLLVGGILIPYQTFPLAWNRVIAYVIYGQWTLYVIATGLLLKGLLKTLFTQPSGLKKREVFWLLIFLSNFIFFLSYLLALCGVAVLGICLYISGAVLFSFMLYLTVSFYLYGARMERILQVPQSEQPGKPEKRKIAESDAQAWIEKLEKAIVDKDLYKDPNLKLSDLAQKINISTHQLSQLLNENLGKSFSTYINEYRIKEACKLITIDDRLTLEAIGYEVGYNSKSTFYTAFKKVTDTTPAHFKESMEKNNTK